MAFSGTAALKAAWDVRLCAGCPTLINYSYHQQPCVVDYVIIHI